MPHRIGMAIVCLHISAVIYLLLGVLMFPLFSAMPEMEGMATPFAVGMLVFCALLAIGIEVVVAGLKRRKFWAWVAGLVIFGLYLPSLFLPLGAFGMWGLLDKGSQAQFGIGGAQPR